MSVTHPTLIADGVHYTHPQSGASDDKAEGVIVGIVAGLMACGLTFDQALNWIALNWRQHEAYRPQCIPLAWREAFRRKLDENPHP